MGDQPYVIVLGLNSSIPPPPCSPGNKTECKAGTTAINLGQCLGLIYYRFPYMYDNEFERKGDKI